MSGEIPGNPSIALALASHPKEGEHVSRNFPFKNAPRIGKAVGKPEHDYVKGPHGHARDVADSAHPVHSVETHQAASAVPGAPVNRVEGVARDERGRFTSAEKGDTDKPRQGGKITPDETQAGQNKPRDTVTSSPADYDVFDEGATNMRPDVDQRHQHDNALAKGTAASVDFPMLDVEPNTITSRNVDEAAIQFMRSRSENNRIDFEQLAYESMVSRLHGHKVAYNSTSYGVLTPDYDLHCDRKVFNKRVFKLDSESLMESLAEAPFGLKKVNKRLADDMKREQRTFTMTTSTDHGGPSMYRRGLNQFKNKALKHTTLDPNAESVEVQKQVARDGMRINKLNLFPSEHTRVRLKARYNQNRGAERDGTQYAAARGEGASGVLDGPSVFGSAGVTESVPQQSLVGYVVNPGPSAVFSPGSGGVQNQ